MSQVKLKVEQSHSYKDDHKIIKGGVIFSAVKDGFEALVNKEDKSTIELLLKGYGAKIISEVESEEDFLEESVYTSEDADCIPEHVFETEEAIEKPKPKPKRKRTRTRTRTVKAKVRNEAE